MQGRPQSLESKHGVLNLSQHDLDQDKKNLCLGYSVAKNFEGSLGRYDTDTIIPDATLAIELYQEIS